MNAERLVAAIAPVVRDYVQAMVALVRADLAKAIAEVPAGPPGEAGAAGAAGAPGRDGAPGEPGRDGSDGLGFDDLAFEYDGERTITPVLTRGVLVKRLAPMTFPVVIDRGVWEPTKVYTRGDMVSCNGGNGYICQHEAAAGMLPGEGGVWRLAIRKGKDAPKPRPHERHGREGDSSAGTSAAHD